MGAIVQPVAFDIVSCKLAVHCNWRCGEVRSSAVPSRQFVRASFAGCA